MPRALCLSPRSAVPLGLRREFIAAHHAIAALTRDDSARLSPTSSSGTARTAVASPTAQRRWYKTRTRSSLVICDNDDDDGADHKLPCDADSDGLCSAGGSLQKPDAPSSDAGRGPGAAAARPAAQRRWYKTRARPKLVICDDVAPGGADSDGLSSSWGSPTCSPHSPASPLSPCALSSSSDEGPDYAAAEKCAVSPSAGAGGAAVRTAALLPPDVELRAPALSPPEGKTMWHFCMRLGLRKHAYVSYLDYPVTSNITGPVRVLGCVPRRGGAGGLYAGAHCGRCGRSAVFHRRWPRVPGP